jgi:hypothetical protein
MAEWTVAEGISHPEVPGMVFCTVDTPDDDQDVRYLPDRNAAMHFLVGNKLKFGDTIVMAGEPVGEPRKLKVDKVLRGTRICFDVGGVGLPEGITELFNPEDMILWLTNVLQPGDSVAYLED